jgi:glycerol-3-phosphate acyltransferase PlsY
MIYVGLISFLVATYLIASIPFGVVISKLVKAKDIRQQGAKNIGATNVTRVLGKKYGLLTLILDALKGALMVMLARLLFSSSTYLGQFLAAIALVAVIGHVFPVYLKFKGGKGVATTIAVILAINPVMGIANMLIWLMIFFVTRVSAIASLLSILLVVLFAICDGIALEQILLYISLFVLVAARHKENIIRIKNGKENSI